MGYGQFMPSSYKQYAVDFNGDGHINLWDPVDAIGSVANYFKAHGWVPGGRGGAGERSGAGAGKRLQNQLQHFAAVRGRPNANAAAGQCTAGESAASRCRTGYQYWYGLPNFYTITRYNHSTHYAMAVWQLGLAVSQARVPAASPFSQ